MDLFRGGGRKAFGEDSLGKWGEYSKNGEGGKKEKTRPAVACAGANREAEENAPEKKKETAPMRKTLKTFCFQKL